MATINGTSGDEELDGTTGNDTINGLNGNDVLYGDAGNDTLNGGNGVDDLEGGAGNDTLDGGADFDFASYVLATSGVTVSLATATAQNVGGGQGSDTLKNIEGLIGSDYADTLTGNSGNNILDGFGGKDTLNGGAGDDILQVSDTSTYVAGSKFDGGTGNDILSINGVIDISGSTVVNMEGLQDVPGCAVTLSLAQFAQFSDVEVDQLIFNTAGTVNLSHATTLTTYIFSLGVGGITLDLTGHSPPSSDTYTIAGSSGVDVITGSSLVKNDINAFAGNDTLTGSALADTIQAGSGNDVVHGGDGNDAIYGGDQGLGPGDGNDTIYGEGGNDYIHGGDGTNTLSGGDGDDTIYSNGSSVMYGDAGDDTLASLGTGNDTLYGDAGDDTLTSGDGVDSLYGGDGNDTIHAEHGTVTIDAGNGDDLVIATLAQITSGGGVAGGAGTDTLSIEGSTAVDLSAVPISGFEKYTGASSFTLTVAQLAGVVSIDGNTLDIAGTGAVDFTHATEMAHTITLDNAGISLDLTGFTAHGITINGTSGNESISGGEQDDVIYGNGGSDTLKGNGGNDQIFGDAGSDTIIGGAGDDTLYGRAGNDTFNGGSGNDTIYGDDGNDTINSGDGADQIHPGAGSDIVNAGIGDDLIFIDSSSEAIAGKQIYGGDGYDELLGGPNVAVDLSNVTVGADVEQFIFDDVTLKGSQLSHLQYFGANNMHLSDGGTFDWSGIGYFSAQQIFLANANTNLTLPDIATPGYVYVYAGSGNDTITAGASNGLLVIHGGAGNDVIHGSSNADQIYGDGGSDIVDGGDGNDTFYVESRTDLANDQYIGGGGYDQLSLPGDVLDSIWDMSGVSMSGVESIYASYLRLAMTGSQILSLENIQSYGIQLLDGGTFDLTGVTIWTNAIYLSDEATNLTVALDGVVNIYGGEGNDTIVGSTTFSLGIYGGGGNDVLTAAPNNGLGLYGGDGDDIITGGSYGDTMEGDAGNDIIHMELGGDEYVLGGTGDDSFYADATLTAADRIDGGDGNDTLYLNGDYSGGVVFSTPDSVFATTLANVENIVLAAGHSYKLTTNNATVAAGQTLTVDGSALGAGNALTFIGTAETSGNFNIIGGAGADALTGGAGADIFHLERGGNDTVSGGNGNDAIYMGGALTAADGIDGGAGNDTVYLDGYYSAGLTFGATTMVNVENLVLAGGHNYNLTLDNATIAAGQTLNVDASALGASNTLTFNDTADTDGNVSVTGGAGNDSIYLGGGLTAADSVNGGGGTDRVYLNGNYAGGVTFGATTMTNVDNLILSAANNYNLTTNNATVASGQLLYVDASALGAANALTFNGANELDGRFYFTAGAGNDALTGGAQNDIFHLENGGNDTVSGVGGNDAFYLAGTLTAADQINGGAGTDTVYLNGNYAGGLTFGAATMTNVDYLILSAGNDYNLTSNNATVAAGQLFYVDASALGAGNALTFNGSVELDGRFFFTGGAGNDTFTGGAGIDPFHLENGGNDTASGSGGNDTFYLAGTLSAADSIDGGAGNDYVYLNGNYTGGVVFGATTMTNVENLVLSAGNNYNLTTSDTTAAAGQLFYVNASALGAANTLIFNGAAELDGRLYILDGAGNGTLTGGALNDTFRLETGGNDIASGGGGNDSFYLSGALTAADSIDGGAGTDYVYLNGNYASGVSFGAATMTNVEYIELSAGNNYNLTTNNATVASGQLLYVDASTLGATSALTFNGAAELDGRFYITGGAGNDALTGGAQNDTFHLENGGTDTASGGNGNDSFYLGTNLTAADHFDGGAGTDYVYLNGNYAGGLTFGAATMTNVEYLILSASNDYNLTTNNATVASGQLLYVDASALGSGNTLTFNGAAELDGRFNFTGGAGNDTLTGGAGNDIFTGGAGADLITGNGGSDHFVYGAVSQSTSVNYDTLAGVDFANDRFDLTSGVTGIDLAAPPATLSTASFDTDLANATNGHLLANHAELFTANAGTLSGQTFLIVDVNGIAGYQANADLVFHLTGQTGSLATTDFI